MSQTTFLLSFADTDRTPGQQFLGAALVEVAVGRTVVQAVDVAREHGCNPGGQVLGYDMGCDWQPQAPRNVLLSREQMEQCGLQVRSLKESTEADSCTACHQPTDAPAPSHPQVDLEHSYLGTVAIDKELAPLIAALWARGVDTSNSCQDNVPGNYVWIEFPDVEDAQHFLHLAAGKPGKNNLHARLLEVADYGSWRYDMTPENNGVSCDQDGRLHRRRVDDFYFTVSIRFPHYDLYGVVRNVFATNEVPDEDRYDARGRAPASPERL